MAHIVLVTVSAKAKGPPMMHRLMFAGLVCAGSLTACATDPDLAATDQTISDDACPPNTPAALAPAADQDLAFTFDATGVQIYNCTGGAWVFSAPDAQLYQSSDRHPVGHHYAGPTWEYQDGSLVVAAKTAGATVDPSAIPWLLLTAKGHGPIDGRMSEVTSIQRLETAGGLAPVGACTNGAVANVPYTATYYFYKTRPDHPERNTRCGG
jgi:hypothetical protein